MVTAVCPRTPLGIDETWDREYPNRLRSIVMDFFALLLLVVFFFLFSYFIPVRLWIAAKPPVRG